MSRELSLVTPVFQDGRLQTISGNAIQRLIDMNNNFDAVVCFIVSGSTTYAADDRRVIHDSPPWGLRTGRWPAAMECLITFISRLDTTLLMDYCKRYSGHMDVKNTATMTGRR
jgi:hypothetical protein